ncbi:MAG TPA: hypothetical protein VG246_13070 [Acidimicrobiales bacterium]|jgi:hypothetical protein|nr:hypothetical protein [Acidimicrobiales bacterium]
MNRSEEEYLKMRVEQLTSARNRIRHWSQLGRLDIDVARDLLECLEPKQNPNNRGYYE